MQILECMLEGNELPDTTNESTAIGVSNQQYEGKIEDVVNDVNQCSHLNYQLVIILIVLTGINSNERDDL